MNEDDFNALVCLIEALIYYHAETRAHPNDQPRNAMMMREREDAIEHAKRQMVL